VKKIINGDHLKQDWYKPLNLQSEKKPHDACKVVLKVQNEVKQKISYEHRQAVLRRIQTDFGGDINLVESVREFIKDGRLVKISEQSSREMSYHFFLFSHIFVYASDGMQTKFKIHRVIHLSLCKIIDLKNFAVPNSFKILSPQKSFVVAAGTTQEKKDWLDALGKQVKMVMEERKNYMESLGIHEKEKEKEKEKRKRKRKGQKKRRR